MKNTYPKIFQEIVEEAIAKSEKFYQDNSYRYVNPFYIGFGNPCSEILIIGQEKAIPKDNYKQIKVESSDNPYQWNKLINENIQDIGYNYYENGDFKNPLHPYEHKPRTRGQTWKNYQNLIEKVFPELTKLTLNNSFLQKCFITELNHYVSLKSMGIQENDLRSDFTSHKFYKSFPVTILAIGDYLKPHEIEEKYNVIQEKEEDDSKKERKLKVYRNHSEKRTILHTRQMSNFFFNKNLQEEYTQRIAKKIKENIS